ncbi:MAG: hypothetical protein GX071_14065 [Gammaproteobacteria bacterium]|nr:hypothetical protein [Gammaproteobacteria bacterium]
MTTPQVTPLPDPPVRTDAPDDFSQKADIFLGALPPWGMQLNLITAFVRDQAQLAMDMAAAAGSAEGMPALAGNAGKVLAVKPSELGIEYVTLDAGTLGAVLAEDGEASGLTLSGGYTEEVYAVSGTTPALSPTNGSIQTWVLSANSTPTAGTWSEGQSVTLMIEDGADHTIDWASLSITWNTGGGTAPELNTGGYTTVVIWKVGAELFGARVGDA